MQVLAEIHGKTKKEKLLKTLMKLEEYDGFNIPDSPLGYPSVMPSVIATVVRNLYGNNKRVIINQRLADVNELFIASLSLTSKLVEFDVTFTFGDKPKVGREVGYMTSEDAIALLKKYSPLTKAGMIISLRKSKEEIDKRLKNNDADFYLVLRLEDPNQIARIDTSKLIPYIIVETESNKQVTAQLEQPTFNVERAIELISVLGKLGVQAVLISTLGDVDGLVRVIKRIRT
ncbi:hypothetical protein [Sulfolobus acidocaldarius]|uniref:Conserved Archaeal protein n=4 Tax=Sulfolobus acidocaldarius TaxID=2285 RepID=Q4JBN4_SULAC|nr:hypothetical protein [Sulfolobus acidocaldarius]AAY79795.1 conserved Archaeal protein [Sulfolobus acidocaldarius DSM 639]AGE70353.1 hypothetical protein SacN8_01860 [Sulfolobus acidocaldarius N8]AGE72628.1 hypothetical protein SacRon12I_01860 [Sulfolobus acidocaldarius Ron12/I]ALU29248.1 hypothetical protein ATY89_04390 [Sulfolobus acidocaldarius]ALU31977.1 hypothetical protein ATZ20_07415 [Sulfolobus acidocaldarius]